MLRGVTIACLAQQHRLSQPRAEVGVGHGKRDEIAN